MAKLDETLACDLAVREGVKAVLSCDISAVGGVYSLTARLVEPNKRETVMSQAVQVAEKNQVLPALDLLAKTIRQKLGESLEKMSHQSLALPKATERAKREMLTGSLRRCIARRRT